MPSRSDLVAALFASERVSARALATQLNVSVDEVIGFFVGLRHLDIVDRVEDGDAEDGDADLWTRTPHSPATPLETITRIANAGIDLSQRLRHVGAKA